MSKKEHFFQEAFDNDVKYLKRRIPWILQLQGIRLHYNLPLCNPSNIDRNLNAGAKEIQAELEKLAREQAENFKAEHPYFAFGSIRVPTISNEHDNTLNTISSCYKSDLASIAGSNFNLFSGSSELLDIDPTTGEASLSERGLKELRAKHTITINRENEELVKIAEDFIELATSGRKALAVRGVKDIEKYTPAQIFQSFVWENGKQLFVNPKLFHLKPTAIKG